MKNFAIGYAIALGLLAGGCSNNDHITATALPAPIVKIDQIPENVKGSSPIQVDYSSQVVAQKQIVALSFLYSADGTNFIPVANVATNTQSYEWVVPRIDSTGAKIKIIAKDSRGFTSEKTSNSFNILSTPPNITVTSNNAISSSSNNATFSGTCKPGNTIQFFGGLSPQISDGVKAHYANIVTPTCAEDGTWSLTANESTINTTFSYTLQQADIVGNYTQISFTWNRTCPSGQYADGETCRAQICSPASIDTDQTGCSLAGSRTRSCSMNGSAWSNYSSCACSTGYTGADCSGCSAGYFKSGNACVPDVCTPGSINSDNAGCSLHGTRTETCSVDGSGFGAWGTCACSAGYTGANCSTCTSGYYPNGNSCMPDKCTPSTVNSDSTGCSNHGSRTQSCAANGSDWEAFGACTCSVGYSGPTCASCASGYFFNGTSCVADICTPSTTQNDSSGCGNNGSRARACASDGSAWGNYGSCSCSAGYAGATCSSCASGYFFNGTACTPNVCTPGSTQSDTSTCSNQGSHTQTCASDGSGWGAYTSCSCNAGYNGSNCSSCAAGFYPNGGGTCAAQACAPNSVQTDTTGCSSHGLRSQSCSTNGSQWAAWGSCACNLGYTGADCSSCDASQGYSRTINGSCQPQVSIQYVLTESATQYYTDTVSVDANLSLSTSQGQTIAEIYTNTPLTSAKVNSGDTVNAVCSGGANYGYPWPTSRSPATTLTVTDQNGAQIYNQTNTNQSVNLNASFVATAGNIYTVDCHSSRSATCSCNSGWTPGSGNETCTNDTPVPMNGAHPAIISQQEMSTTAKNAYYAQQGIAIDNTSLKASQYFAIQTNYSQGITGVLFGDQRQPVPIEDMTFLPVTSKNKILPAYQYWQNHIRNDNIIIQSSNDAGNGWMTKGFCVNPPASDTYVFHVGGDNEWKIYVDNVEFAECTTNNADGSADASGSVGSACFVGPQFIATTLSAGPHTIQLKYQNLPSDPNDTDPENNPGGIWFEIYHNSLKDVQNATNLNLISTTKDLLQSKNPTWDNANNDVNNTGCPAGATLNACTSMCNYQPVSCN